MAATLSAAYQQAESRYICVVTETYPPEINGVALTLAHLVKGLRARGHTVRVVRPRQAMADCFPSNYDSEVTLVRGLPLPRYPGLQFGLPAGGLLLRCWTQRRPDAVYVATEGPLGWSAVRAAQRLGLPVLSGFHTNYQSYAKYYLAGRLQSMVFRYLRNFHNGTMGTLVASQEMRDRLQLLGFNNVSILGRGVDSQLFNPECRSAELRHQWGLSDNDLAVICVGRVAAEKNLKLAIETYHAMKKTNDRVKFVIVGDGPLLAALRRAYPDLIFRGVHSGDQLARHYASADVFLFPSETETFGNVTLEAMASGLAVIAYDYAAARVQITHGETGVLVPYGDAKAFVASAAMLMREPLLLNRIRRQARNYIASANWPRVVERFEGLLTGARQETDTAIDPVLAA